MKTVGLVTEYNPFHLGHKYHVEKSKEITGASHAIAIMSSSFVQRGEPALVDKWTRAKMAIDNGVDLVLELPFVYSVQTAELFAYGALKILDSMKVVDSICFGSELGTIEPLYKVAKVLVAEPEDYRNILKDQLKTGMAYSASRGFALQKYIDTIESNNIFSYESLLRESNNILGIEYLKSLIKLESKIVPYTVNRLGDNYKDEEITSTIASATAIRNLLLEKDQHKAKDYLPEASYKQLITFYEKYKTFNSLENYKDILHYLFRTKEPEELKEFMDMENGLENRILEKGLQSYNIEEIIDGISTRRYPLTRIKRILIHLLMNLKRKDIEGLYTHPIQYIRVLGCNKKGMEILNKVKDMSEIAIITKFADYKEQNNSIIDEFMAYEEKATDLYYLGISKDFPYRKMDYITSPYIAR